MRKLSIASEINRINQNIAAAYSACDEKRAPCSTARNSANLADTIAGISSLRFEIAAEKPTSNIKTNVIYLIPNSFIRASLLIHTLLCRLLFFSCASAALPIPDNLIF